jgi:hypothetical protein
VDTPSAVAGIQAVVDIPFPAAVGSPFQDTAAVDSTPVAEGRRRSKASKFNIKKLVVTLSKNNVMAANLFRTVCRTSTMP